jgi:hypothetical protein
MPSGAETTTLIALASAFGGAVVSGGFALASGWLNRKGEARREKERADREDQRERERAERLSHERLDDLRRIECVRLISSAEALVALWPTKPTDRAMALRDSAPAGVEEANDAFAGNARKLTQANDWKVTHPSGVLFFPMSVYDSSPGLWEVCETARVGGGGRARRGAGSRFASACGNGGPGAAAGGGSGAQRRGRPPLGPRFPSGAAPSIAHACVGWVGAAGRGRRRVARPRRDGGAVARKISR